MRERERERERERGRERERERDYYSLVRMRSFDMTYAHYLRILQYIYGFLFNQGFISNHLPKLKDAAVIEGLKSWWEENAGKNSASVLSEGKEKHCYQVQLTCFVSSV